MVARNNIVHAVAAARHPVPHDGKSAKDRDLRIVCQHCHGVDGATMQRLGQDLRRILQIHQDDVSVCGLELVDPFAHDGGIGIEVAAAQRVVTADLPDHELRLVGKDVRCEATQHLLRVLSPHALVDHLDLEPGPAPLELGSELRRIGMAGIGGADPFGRRRADGDDGERLAVADRLRRIRQSDLESRHRGRRSAIKRPIFSRIEQRVLSVRRTDRKADAQSEQQAHPCH